MSAYANKLYTIQIKAREYAALIMEELDPENAGYILVISNPHIIKPKGKLGKFLYIIKFVGGGAD